MGTFHWQMPPAGASLLLEWELRVKVLLEGLALGGCTVGMFPRGRMEGPTDGKSRARVPPGPLPCPLLLCVSPIQAPQAAPAVIALWGGRPRQHPLAAHGPEAVRGGAEAGPALQGLERHVGSALARPDTPAPPCSWLEHSPGGLRYHQTPHMNLIL